MYRSPAPGVAGRARSGFTLIELLTVIAIIGILVAILIPTLAAVRKQAATAADLSNLREIGTAIQMHMNENRGMLPHRSVPISGTALNPTDGDRWSFHEAVDRYMSRGGKFASNSIFNFLNRPLWTSRFAEAFPGYAPIPGYVMTGPIAYSFNPYIFDVRWAGRYASIPEPSRIVLMGEVNQGTSARVANPMTTNAAPALVGDVETNYRVNREGKALYLFCDGRLATLAGDQSEPALTAASRPNHWRWW